MLFYFLVMKAWLMNMSIIRAKAGHRQGFIGQSQRPQPMRTMHYG